MKGYMTGAAAEQIGATGHTLRKWDRLGLLTPKRNSHGLREYTVDDIARGRELLKQRLAARGSGLRREESHA